MSGFDHLSGNYYPIGDANLYYEIIGDEKAPVLLFLHGGLGNMEDFNAIISEIPDQFRIIGIDCRGHGKSTLGSQDLTYELLQKDVESILKHLNITDLSIFGFSNGGTIAYRLAAFSPLKINKLITLGAPWHTKHTEHLREPFSKLTSEIWKVHSPSEFDTYMRLNPEKEFDSLFRQAIKMALDTNLSGRPNELVRSIKIPLLIMRGENDPVFSEADMIELSKIISHAHLHTIPSAGHEAFLDQPELFMKEFKNFIN